ncbi:MAG: OmpH family outer membrane protein [Flavobacteriales bacterium]
MNWTNGLISIVVAIAVAFLVSWYCKPAIGYADLNKVFSEFEMKKELQKDYDKQIRFFQSKMDSSKFAVAKLKTDWEANRENEALYNHLMNEWQRNEALVNEAQGQIDELTLQFDNQIQTQLKQYLNDFGKSKNLDMLMGLTNDGTLLYGGQSMDYTQAAIEYVNEKYLDK